MSGPDRFVVVSLSWLTEDSHAVILLLPCCRLPCVFICILDVCHHPGPWYIASCSHFSLQKAMMTRQHRLLWRSDTEGCVGGLWLKYDTVLRSLRCVIRLVITRHCHPMPATQDLGGQWHSWRSFFVNFPLFKVFQRLQWHKQVFFIPFLLRA